MKLALPFSECERLRARPGLGRHKETLPRTLVFIRHQMACFAPQCRKKPFFLS